MAKSIEEQVYDLLDNENKPLLYRKLPPLRDKKGNIIYCHFCLNHPSFKSKVPAVTYTEEGHIPRCAPCGRWVE